jgi:hypothetical protein
MDSTSLSSAAMDDKVAGRARSATEIQSPTRTAVPRRTSISAPSVVPANQPLVACNQCPCDMFVPYTFDSLQCIKCYHHVDLHCISPPPNDYGVVGSTLPESVSLHVEDVVEAAPSDADAVTGLVPALHSVREWSCVQ